MSEASAKELRAAATRLRILARVATPGPWESLDGGDRIVAWKVGPGGFDDDFDYVMPEPMDHAGNAQWIATVHPGLARPLADLLEAAIGERVAEWAVAVARIVNKVDGDE